MLALLLLAAALTARSADGKFLASLDADELVVRDAEGLELLRREVSPDPASLAFSPDGKRVGVLSKDGKGESFALAEPGADPVRADLEALWSRLLEEDGGAAVRELVSVPELSVPFLAARVAPVRVDEARILALIRDLDHDDYRTREGASAALGALGRIAEPHLRRAEEATSSAEVKARCQALLEAMASKAGPAPRGECLRRVRALQILGLVGGEQARAALQAVAEGAPGAAETEAARKALASR